MAQQPLLAQKLEAEGVAVREAVAVEPLAPKRVQTNGQRMARFRNRAESVADKAHGYGGVPRRHGIVHAAILRRQGLRKA